MFIIYNAHIVHTASYSGQNETFNLWNQMCVHSYIWKTMPWKPGYWDSAVFSECMNTKFPFLRKEEYILAQSLTVQPICQEIMAGGHTVSNTQTRKDQCWFTLFPFC